MSNLAQHIPYAGGNRPAEADDSWNRPVRMLYLLTIEVRDTRGTRFYFVLARNYHNAEAVQRAFDGDGAVDVSFEPSVERYLDLMGVPHDSLCEVRARQILTEPRRWIAADVLRYIETYG